MNFKRWKILKRNFRCTNIIIVVCLICLFVFIPALRGQFGSVVFPNNLSKVDIPFEMQGNFIILPVMFQRLFPLKFIYDTGAENSILLRKEISDLLNVHYERDIVVYGSDMRTPLGAKIARRMYLDLPEVQMTKDILVLNEDYFRFDESAGVDIHGILGAETFRGHVVKINFAKQLLTVYRDGAFKPPAPKEGYEILPIEILRNKPYLNLALTLQNDSLVHVKLLLDTGASLGMLLYNGTTRGLTMPTNALKGNIGRGLGGNLEGHIGRLKKVALGKYALHHVVSRFQSLPFEVDTATMSQRNGILGAEILARFNVIIDYVGQKIYLQPNKEYYEPFVYDRSGMSVVAGGTSLNEFTVLEVLPNTPAASADIRAGDRIIKMGMWNTNIYKLSNITRKLQGKAGKEIRLTILRDGQKIKKSFILRDLI